MVAESNGDQAPESPKLERPQSLSIQTNDEIVEDGPGVAAVEELAHKVRELEVEEEPHKKKTPSHLTEQGFFDLKFYHNKLW